MQVAHESSARVTQPFGTRELRAGREVDIADPVLHSKQYRILELLGEGGMGRVYRAYDPVLERDVAFKVLKPELPQEARDRFRHEARVGARLCHPNIARVFDLGVLPGSNLEWFAMEYLEGRDLETLLSRARRRSLHLPPRLTAIVFDRMLDALAHTHDAGLIHRDIKPANIFVSRVPGRAEVSVKLLDFGVAVERFGGNDTGPVCGDPRYVAPEQALGEAGLDHRADLYAAGVSLFEALAGTHPFEPLVERGAAALIHAHCHEGIPALAPRLPRAWPEALCNHLDNIVRTACAMDPSERYSDATQMRLALRNALVPSASDRPSPCRPRALRVAPRPRLRVGSS